MEVEFRRLSFLKQTFSQTNQAPSDGPSLIVASSIKALRRERETLAKLLRRRLTDEERNLLYRKFGIGLDTKRRRLQFVNCKCCNTNDMEHITESASTVVGLVQFSEKGHALKEMFGLNLKMYYI